MTALVLVRCMSAPLQGEADGSSAGVRPGPSRDCLSISLGDGVTFR